MENTQPCSWIPSVEDLAMLLHDLNREVLRLKDENEQLELDNARLRQEIVRLGGVIRTDLV